MELCTSKSFQKQSTSLMVNDCKFIQKTAHLLGNNANSVDSKDLNLDDARMY